MPATRIGKSRPTREFTIHSVSPPMPSPRSTTAPLNAAHQDPSNRHHVLAPACRPCARRRRTLDVRDQRITAPAHDPPQRDHATRTPVARPHQTRGLPELVPLAPPSPVPTTAPQGEVSCRPDLAPSARVRTAGRRGARLAAHTLAEPGKRAARLAPQRQRAGAEGCDPGSLSVRRPGSLMVGPGCHPTEASKPTSKRRAAPEERSMV
jgi:hypothetical protein